MTTNNDLLLTTAHTYQGCKHSLGYGDCYNSTHPCSGLSHPRGPSINIEGTLGLDHTLVVGCHILGCYTLGCHTLGCHTLGYTRHID